MIDIQGKSARAVVNEVFVLLQAKANQEGDKDTLQRAQHTILKSLPGPAGNTARKDLDDGTMEIVVNEVLDQLQNEVCPPGESPPKTTPNRAKALGAIQVAREVLSDLLWEVVVPEAQEPCEHGTVGSCVICRHIKNEQRRISGFVDGYKWCADLLMNKAMASFRSSDDVGAIRLRTLVRNLSDKAQAHSNGLYSALDSWEKERAGKGD